VTYRHSEHWTYYTEYDIVRILKYRQRLLNPGFSAYLKELFSKILEEIPNCEIVKFSIQVDHVNVLTVIQQNMQ
jgi:putative transposase